LCKIHRIYKLLFIDYKIVYTLYKSPEAAASYDKWYGQHGIYIYAMDLNREGNAKTF